MIEEETIQILKSQQKILDEEVKLLREKYDFVIAANKPSQQLNELLKHQRKIGYRLDGHGKIARERKCMCGEELYLHNGFWVCREEQKHWNILFMMLRVK